jgi:predicted GNAT superfamily acetyltransferase
VAGSETAIEIRPLAEIAEFREAVDLQKKIWGFEEIELLPVRLFVVASKVGGQAFGAFDKNRMVAFLLAIPGVKRDAQAYLHSHMLGVLKDYRDHGLGRKLKLAQRADALERGFKVIEWTFDPLEIKNAFFNLERLGAVVRRFVYNQYGTTSSTLHGGLPTDRCIAEWHIASPRVEAVLKGQPLEHPEIAARIAIPNSIAEIKAREPKLARDIQAAAGEQFDKHFRNGLAVIGFERGDEEGAYLLAPWDSK